MDRRGQGHVGGKLRKGLGEYLEVRAGVCRAGEGTLNCWVKGDPRTTLKKVNSFRKFYD